MRLVKKDINTRDGTGSATLLPQEPEDMVHHQLSKTTCRACHATNPTYQWHLYNLIRRSDILRAPAIRKVTKDTSTGSHSSTVRTTLTIRVLSTDFDPSAGALHVAGRVCEENAHVSVGAHHTLDLELNRQFSLQKGGDDGWDSVALATLAEATDPRRAAQVWAVVMHEGTANICLVTDAQTLLRQRIEASVPRKRAGAGADAHDRGVERFFETTLQALLRHVDVSAATGAGAAAADPSVKAPPLLLASPGFTAANFLRHVQAHATRTGDKALMAYARSSVLVAHSSSGHVHALAEVLRAPAVLARLSDTKYAREAAAMDRFETLVRQDEGRAWYGPREVERAVDKGAVGRGGGVLLISNKLFRSQDVAVRKRWVALVEKVRNVEGGEVRVLSSAHESGKRLEALGDIGAILTFPLLDLDEEEVEGTPAQPAGGQRHDRIPVEAMQT